MPIYDIACNGCHCRTELLALSTDKELVCPECGSPDIKRLMSAPSSLTGRLPLNVPGPTDTACCGNSPAKAGCAGPGSCCGKNGSF